MKNKAGSDERAISWKVQLPHDPQSRVLGIGLDPGLLKGLLRNWSNVDSYYGKTDKFISGIKGNDETCKIRYCTEFDELKPEYDIIIVGYNPFPKNNGTDKLTHLMNQNSILVLLNGCSAEKNSAWFKNINFSQINYYAALPKNSPRLYIPLKTRSSINKGLSFHTPGSFIIRTGYFIVKLLCRLGASFLLFKNPLIIAYKSENRKGELLNDFLSRLLDIKIDDLIIYTGSERPGRKITAFAIVKNGKNLVLKISDTKEGCAAIKNENSALINLNSTNLSCNVPDLIVEQAEWQGYFLQVQSEINQKISKQIPELKKQHYDFLVRMSFINRHVLKFNQTKTYLKLIHEFECSELSKYPNAVQQSIEIIKDPEFAKKCVICHRTHGDFAPWNIKNKGPHLYVIDWEDSLPDGYILTDVFHFIFRQAALVGPWPGCPNLLEKIINSSNIFSAKSNLPNFDFYPVLLVWMLNEYLLTPSKRIEDLIATFIADYKFNVIHVCD